MFSTAQSHRQHRTTIDNCYNNNELNCVHRKRENELCVSKARDGRWRTKESDQRWHRRWRQLRANRVIMKYMDPQSKYLLACTPDITRSFSCLCVGSIWDSIWVHTCPNGFSAILMCLKVIMNKWMKYGPEEISTPSPCAPAPDCLLMALSFHATHMEPLHLYLTFILRFSSFISLFLSFFALQFQHYAMRHPKKYWNFSATSVRRNISIKLMLRKKKHLLCHAMCSTCRTAHNILIMKLAIQEQTRRIKFADSSFTAMTVFVDTQKFIPLNDLALFDAARDPQWPWCLWWHHVHIWQQAPDSKLQIEL